MVALVDLGSHPCLHKAFADFRSWAVPWLAFHLLIRCIVTKSLLDVRRWCARGWGATVNNRQRPQLFITPLEDDGGSTQDP